MISPKSIWKWVKNTKPFSRRKVPNFYIYYSFI